MKINFQNGAHLKKVLFLTYFSHFLVTREKLKKIFRQHISQTHTYTYFAHPIDFSFFGCSTIRPNTFRPITFRPMSFCPKTICPTIFSPHDFCPYTILSCMIYVQKYFVHNVLGHKYLVQNRFSPKAFCLNTFSTCPLLSTQF